MFEKSDVFLQSCIETSNELKEDDIMTKKDTGKLISKLFVIIFVLLVLVIILGTKVIAGI